MAKSKSVPSIRFSGFEHEWEIKQFDAVFDTISNNTLSRDNLNYVNGSTQNVHYGDILTVFGEYVDVVKEQLPFLNDEETALKFQNALLKDGDIIFADTAEDETVGKCIEICNVGDRKILSGLHTIPCRPKEKFASKYMGYYLNSDAYHQKLLPLMQGVKVIAISKTGIRGTELILTSDEKEQAKIGEFLSQLDEKIKYAEEKIRKIKIFKQSMLIKMLPKEGKKVPEIRFNGFTEDWKQRKVGEYCDMYNGDRSSKYPNAQDIVSEGIPFINAGDLENGHVKLDTCNKISREKYDSLGGAKLQLGDIVYCLRGTLGKNAYIDNFPEGTVASSLVAIRPKNIDGKFMFHVLNSDIEYKQRVVYDEGAAQPNLSAKSVSEFLMPVPHIDEQKMISEYFDNLDNLITLYQSELEKLKNMKAACMKRMFV